MGAGPDLLPSLPNNSGQHKRSGELRRRALPALLSSLATSFSSPQKKANGVHGGPVITSISDLDESPTNDQTVVFSVRPQGILHAADGAHKRRPSPHLSCFRTSCLHPFHRLLAARMSELIALASLAPSRIFFRSLIIKRNFLLSIWKLRAQARKPHACLPSTW